MPKLWYLFLTIDWVAIGTFVTTIIAAAATLTTGYWAYKAAKESGDATKMIQLYEQQKLEAAYLNISFHIHQTLKKRGSHFYITAQNNSHFPIKLENITIKCNENEVLRLSKKTHSFLEIEAKSNFAYDMLLSNDTFFSSLDIKIKTEAGLGFQTTFFNHTDNNIDGEPTRVYWGTSIKPYFGMPG